MHHGAYVNATDDTQQTPLMVAAEKGHGSTVNLLLQAGADPRAQDVYKQTALSQSAAQGHIEAATSLLGVMTVEDLRVEDEEGNTPAMKAAR